MASPLTGEQIIERFERYTDDTTELSTDEELELANDKLRVIYTEQPWEFLRRNKSGTIESDGKISAPADFDEFLENYSDDADIPTMKVVYIGSGAPYFVIPMGQRSARQYNNCCWFDPTDSKINFSQSPGAGTPYQFDYKASPDDIAIDTSPALPPDYHPMIVFLMLIDEEIIKKSKKLGAICRTMRSSTKRTLKT